MYIYICIYTYILTGNRAIAKAIASAMPVTKSIAVAI